MTRKHFIAIAETIRDLPIADADRAIVARYFATLCKSENVRFDRDRFMAACGVAA